MPCCVNCSDETVHKLRIYAQQLLIFISGYKWLTDSYVVEFFAKNNWYSFPKSWQVVLSNLSTPDVAHFLLDHKPPQSFTKVWPLSLLSYRAAAHALALDHIPAETQAYNNQQDPTYQPLDLLCRLHVKEKKRHEISRLAEVINSTCQRVGCKRVVDVGSGQGHLSRLLCFGHGLHVTSIEAVGCHITGASKVDTKIKTIIEKRVARKDDQSDKGIVQSPPQHVECMVHPQITVEEFLNVINNQSDPEKGNLEQSTTNHVGESTLFSEEQNFDVQYLDEEHVEIKTNSGNMSAGCTATQSESREELRTECGFSKEVPETERTRTDEQNDSVIATDICNLLTLKKCEELPYQPRNPNSDSSFVLAGLHTCGDLAPTMLRVFSKCEQARALASVACCYMKMESALPSNNSNYSLKQCEGPTHEQSTDNCCTTTPEKKHNDHTGSEDDCVTKKTRARGYPMSSWLQGLDGSELQFESLELACHSLHSYCQRLKDRDPNLILHGYRATLEVLIQGTKPELTQTHEGIRRIKKAVASVKKPHLKSFEEYAAAVLTKLDIPFTMSLLTELRESLEPMWCDVVTFHSVRSLLGPIIESLVLVDRVLYLHEQGINSKLVPVFDASMSPRNFVLLAVKM